MNLTSTDISRRDLTSLYGVVEANIPLGGLTFLPEAISKVMVLRVAQLYLTLTGSIMQSQFLALVGSLLPDKLNQLDLSGEGLEAVQQALGYWDHSLPDEPSISQGMIEVSKKIVAKHYPSVKPQDYESMTYLIVQGFCRLQQACACKEISHMISAIDYINSLCHSEGQLITWVDEDAPEPYAAYTLTLSYAHASAYQPETRVHMYPYIRKALGEKARYLAATAEGRHYLYNRKRFIDDFIARLSWMNTNTAEEAVAEVDSPRLIKELWHRLQGSNQYGEGFKRNQILQKVLNQCH